MRAFSNFKQSILRFCKQNVVSDDVSIEDLNLLDDKFKTLIYFRARNIQGNVYASHDKRVWSQNDINLIPYGISWEGFKKVHDIEDALLDWFTNLSHTTMRTFRCYDTGTTKFYIKQGAILREDLSLACLFEQILLNGRYTNTYSITFDISVLAKPNEELNRFFIRKLIPYILNTSCLNSRNINFSFANLSTVIINRPINVYVPKETMTVYYNQGLHP